MKDFRELLVWQKAHALVLRVYETTKTLPSEEKYGLTSQIRRSASSIPRTSRRGADAEATLTLLAVFKSRWVQRASLSTT